ncbi:TRAM domain-containing protein [Solemya velesiana gill symbiont]|uniref:TRAM domain-containing protein n=1 Tax=Solemya velesiana gill symbiont TaxID=1918948 RepID=UPI0026AFA509
MARTRRKRLPPDPVRAQVESMSHDGRGVTHIDGKVVFIHGALPGDEIEFLYTRKTKQHDEGQVSSVITASPDRVEWSRSASILALVEVAQPATSKIGNLGFNQAASPHGCFPAHRKSGTW